MAGCGLAAQIPAVPLARLRSSWRAEGSCSLPRGASRHGKPRGRAGAGEMCGVLQRCGAWAGGYLPAQGRDDPPLRWGDKGRRVSGPASLACRKEMWAKSLH